MEHLKNNSVITTENPERISSNEIPVQEKAWWKEAVVYQIYPRSFMDSDGDGIGDLQGIISQLDYVKSLGIDVIWLNPIFTSPNDDNGYDISDYYGIMSEFGTMYDFERLLGETHTRGMKLILDLVVNHTSDEHPWFTEARKSRNNPYYNFYHWWPAEKGDPPFRRSYFDEDGYAWKYNMATDSYYLHYFSRKQPDLNWDNSEVRRKIHDIIRFWFDKGVDGFRMDSIPLIGKDVAFPEIDPSEYPDIFESYAKNPCMHEYLQEMNREVLSHYDILTVGEGSAVKVRDAAKFVEPHRGELQMLYHFGPSEVRNWTGPDASRSGVPYSLIALKKMFTEWDKEIGTGWPVIYLSNHDQPRMVSRFGNDRPKYHELSSKMLNTLLLTMRGTPYVYAGDEIGMSNPRYDKIEDYNDIATLNEYRRLEKTGGDIKTFLRWQKETSRDNGRTPFQWDTSANAGFTTAKTPWLKVSPNYKNFNVAVEDEFQDSILNYFRRLIRLRKENPTLIYGKYTLLDPENIRVYAYLREDEAGRFLVLLNFSSRTAKTECGIDVRTAEVIICNYGEAKEQQKENTITLRPYEAVVYRL